MANQYQIYEASLTAMCNMYRMANDSNEPIAIGELANKIRNYHKDPIYPEGCTIIDDIILNNRIGGRMTYANVYSIEPLSSGGSAKKISLDGCPDVRCSLTATGSSVYGGGTLHIYTDCRNIYLPRFIKTYSNFFSISDRDKIIKDFSSIINCNLFEKVATQPYYGLPLPEAPSSWGTPSVNSVYNSYFNIFNFPNIRALTVHEDLTGNDNVMNFIENSNLESIRYYSGYYINTPLSKNLFYIPENMAREGNVVLPSTASFSSITNIGNINGNLIITSPYIHENLSGLSNSEVNVTFCNDLILRGQTTSALFDTNVIHNFKGLKNIYVDYNWGGFVNFNLINITDDISINIKPYQNLYNYIYPHNYYAFEKIKYGSKDFFLNFQCDLVCNSSTYCFLYPDNIENIQPKKLMQFKNIYSSSLTTCFWTTNYTPPCDYIGLDLSKMEKGIYVENIKTNYNLSLLPSFSKPNFQTQMMTINGILYCGNCYKERSSMWSLDGYIQKVYAENCIEFHREPGTYNFNNFLLHYPDTPTKGDLYLWVNNDSSNTNIWFNFGRNTKFNFHIRRGSFGSLITKTEGSISYSMLEKVYMRDYDPAHRYANGDASYVNLIQISDGVYADTYNHIHIYEYDICPFEVNKEIPRY